ncbi:MAG: GNAT family N-acetyltransferase [Culicoidibacterales bacterium]
MKHQGTQQLTTERLILRALRVSDAQAMYDHWAHSGEVTKFLTWPPHQNVEATQTLLTTWERQYQQPDFYQWGIVLKVNGDEPIGTISVVSLDERIGKMEIGYCLSETFWGQGIMSEALVAVVAFLFNTVGVNRLESRHDPNNPGSGAVLKKAGFLYEGTRRAADWNNQGVCDTCLYGLLQTDSRKSI